MAGGDLLTVKDLLGHKKIDMTLCYSHLSCGHKMKAVQMLDCLGGEGEKLLTSTQMSGIKKTIPCLTITPCSLDCVCNRPELKGELGHKKRKTFVE